MALIQAGVTREGIKIIILSEEQAGVGGFPTCSPVLTQYHTLKSLLGTKIKHATEMRLPLPSYRVNIFLTSFNLDESFNFMTEGCLEMSHSFLVTFLVVYF